MRYCATTSRRASCRSWTQSVARHLALPVPIASTFAAIRSTPCISRDPDRVRRYATGDVRKSRVLRACSAAPRSRWRGWRRGDTSVSRMPGAATGVIDPLLVRAYMRAGRALPAHQRGRRHAAQRGGLHLFAAGAAHRIVKADVASLYPSLMRVYRIGPSPDTLGALLALVDRLVDGGSPRKRARVWRRRDRRNVTRTRRCPRR